MSTGVTLIEVRAEAMDAIKKLKSKELDVKTACEIRNLLSIIIDTARTQVEFLKVIPNSLKERMSEESIKEIAGTLQENNKSKPPDNPYQVLNDINSKSNN